MNHDLVPSLTRSSSTINIGRYRLAAGEFRCFDSPRPELTEKLRTASVLKRGHVPTFTTRDRRAESKR